MPQIRLHTLPKLGEPVIHTSPVTETQRICFQNRNERLEKRRLRLARSLSGQNLKCGDKIGHIRFDKAGHSPIHKTRAMRIVVKHPRDLPGLIINRLKCMAGPRGRQQHHPRMPIHHAPINHDTPASAVAGHDMRVRRRHTHSSIRRKQHTMSNPREMTSRQLRKTFKTELPLLASRTHDVGFTQRNERRKHCKVRFTQDKLNTKLKSNQLLAEMHNRGTYPHIKASSIRHYTRATSINCGF